MSAKSEPDQVAHILFAALPNLLREPQPVSDERAASIPVSDPALGDLIAHELTALLAADPRLVTAAREVTSPPTEPTAWLSLETMLGRALRADPSKLRTLRVLLEAGGQLQNPRTTPADTATAPRKARAAAWLVGPLRQLETGIVLLVLTGIGLAPLLAGPEVERSVLKVFAVIVLAALPGWLFLRFIVFRSGGLWVEYVLHLHRLGMDHHENLPEPPMSSAYYQLWARGGGSILAASDSIYRQKFETYYGRAVARSGTASDSGDAWDRTLLPVFLATAIFAAGWASVFWRDQLFATDLRLPGDVLRFGFMGAYSFILQMLVRRFFQGDLKASAYLGASVRVITVLILVLVVYRLDTGLEEGVLCGLAFVIGFFPLVGMQLIQRAVSVALRRALPTLRNPYPLSELDGLNVWYEARLLEEGIEDQQNLVTANLVDVLLHTRVPVGRLVDWIDQAHLYLLLDPPPADKKRKDHPARTRLRTLGIRTATDLESAFRSPEDLARRALTPSVKAVKNQEFEDSLRTVLNGIDGQPHTGPNVVEAMLKALCNSPNLVHVRHWRDMLSAEHDQPPKTPGTGNGQAQSAQPADTESA